MQPSLVREPFHRPGWVYEEKYDGWRMLAFRDGERVRLVSRQGVDHTERFRDIAAALARLPSEHLILDGEVCVFDQDLVSQFQYLPVPPPDVHATPPVFMVFDCLNDGRDLRGQPLAHRRETLERAIEAGGLVFPARRLAPHGPDAWATVKQRGYEGLVAKDERAPYRGGMTRSWLKVKVQYEGVFIVGDILGTPDAPEGLLVGERVGRRLVYRGVVEWGVRRRLIPDILGRARAVRQSPFHDGADTRRATWLEPRVLVELTYNEMMEGRLRDPVPLLRVIGTAQPGRRYFFSPSIIFPYFIITSPIAFIISPRICTIRGDSDCPPIIPIIPPPIMPPPIIEHIPPCMC